MSHVDHTIFQTVYGLNVGSQRSDQFEIVHQVLVDRSAFPGRIIHRSFHPVYQFPVGLCELIHGPQGPIHQG